MQEIIYKTITHPLFFIPASGIGYLLGHWLAIGKDRRKEFNEVADILFRELTDEVISPDFKTFRRRLPWCKHKAFDKCVTEYKEARSNKNKTEPDSFGRRQIKDTSLLNTTREKLLKFTKRM